MKLFLSLIFCVVFLLYEAMVFSLFFKVVTVITIWPYIWHKVIDNISLDKISEYVVS